MSRRHKGKQAQGDRNEGQGEEIPPATSQVPAVSIEEAVGLLEQAEIVSYELVPAGTNYTFALEMSADGLGRFAGIYKPQRGENPLWDFPSGTLHLRERAAYLTSRFLGWPKIPPTVIREGPFGIGSVQLFVPTEGQPDYFGFRRQRRKELMEIALFDLIVNNADRKAGHCLLGTDGRVWAIDHGLTFNVDPKLRTVLWDFCGEPIPSRLLSELGSLRDDQARRGELGALLEPLLERAEIDAFFYRLERVHRSAKYPQLDPNRNVPWPLV